MNLVISKCVTAVKVSNFSGHYLRNHSTLDIGVLGYIGIFNIRNTLPKFFTFLLGHPVYIYIYIYSCTVHLDIIKVFFYFHQWMHLYLLF
jgi:hypothetical protein